MLNSALNLNQNIFTKDVEVDSTMDGFGRGLLAEGQIHDSVVVLSADLTKSVRAHHFASEFPERFIQCGIAEQNMASIAAGLALSGKIPFIVSHAIFSPSTNWAQIRLSICLSNANVKIVGSHQGFSNGPDGAPAPSLEDIALMRVLPNMTIFNPIDSIQTLSAVETAARIVGPVYIRISKEPTPIITSSGTPFDIEKSNVLVTGKDITLVSGGPITSEVLFAARQLLDKHKIEAEVIATHTIKPLDEKTIIKSAEKTGRIICIEEHQISGGLGGAVAELLSEKFPVPVLRLGMENVFGQSGEYKQLLEKYGLSGEKIVKKVLEFLKK